MVNQLTVSTVIFNPQGSKLLLVRREKHQEWPETWSCPGGRIERSETAEQAALREVEEEVGLNLSIISLVAYFTSPPYYMLVYLATANETEQRVGHKQSSWVPYEDLEKLDLSPNTLKSCMLAYEKFRLFLQANILDHIEAHVELALRYVTNAVIKSSDGKVGWPHYLGLDKIGLIGTSVGILTLLASGYRGILLEQATQTLMQFQSPNGGWPTKTSSPHGAIAVTESTSLAASALFQILGSSHDSVSKAIHWLLNAQNSEGGWGSSDSPLSSPRVYSTALAVRTLALSDFVTSSAVSKAKLWLKSAQNPDGGWGPFSHADRSRREVSTASHTAHVIISLLDAGVKESDETILSAVRYLRRTWNINDGGWDSTSEITTLYENNKEVSRVEFKLFAAPWALIALLRSGESLSDPLVSTTITHLLSTQDPQGFWPHKFTPGEKPIWATYDMISLLAEIQRPRYRPLVSGVTSLLHKDAQLQLSKFITLNWPGDSSSDKPNTIKSKWFFVILSLLLVVTVMLILELTTGAIQAVLTLPLLQQGTVWILTVVLLPALGAFLFEWTRKLLHDGSKGNDSVK